MKVQCTVDVEDDLVISILDSGFVFCTWWDDIRLATRGTDKDNAWAGHVMSGGSVMITVDDKYGDTGSLIDNDSKHYRYRLDRASVEKGLQALALSEKYAHHFADIVKDNHDAITGHVLIQFALFGNVIFD